MSMSSFEDYIVRWGKDCDCDVHENQKSQKETDESSQESVML